MICNTIKLIILVIIIIISIKFLNNEVRKLSINFYFEVHYDDINYSRDCITHSN